MTKVYLIRHAEAEGNRYRRVQGWYDGKITANGYRQIEALSKRFADIHIDAVYASDLFRTQTTAKAIYEPKGLRLNTVPALREVNMGEWEDRTWGELNMVDRERLDLFNATSPDWQAPGGDSFESLRSRVGDAIIELANQHDGQTIAMFCHACAIRNTLCRFRGLSVEESADAPSSDNTAVSLLEIEGDKVRVVFQDDNSHLSEEISTAAQSRKWRAAHKDLGDTPSLWFRPMDLEREGEVYVEARRNAWKTIHGLKNMKKFHGEGFLTVARQNSAYDPRSVVRAYLYEKPAGLLQMDFEREASEGAGWIPFYYMEPEFRSMGLGVQMMGQAVSSFRELGRDKIRLRCAPHNLIAQKFYHSEGFRKIGEEPGGSSMLDILEKPL
jgi:probable phosphoglycerate mutase